MRMIGRLVLFVCLIVSFAVQAQFRIVGYLPTYRAGYINSLQYDKLTHINYSFLIPDANGNISTSGFSYTNLSSLVTKAHTNNVKVLMAFGGWNNGDDSGFRSLAADNTKRTNFVNQAITFVKSNSLDGIDIDWEFPQSADADNYVLLMKQLHDSLVVYNKLLTAAVVPVGSNMAGIKANVFTYVDWLNIMAYDNYGATNHSSYSYAQSATTAWVNKGLPQSKLVLGVPFYAVQPTTKTYAQIVAADSNAPYNDVSNGSYYNGIYTMQDKTLLAQSSGSGIMIWELSQDTFDETSLLKAIYESSPLATSVFAGNSSNQSLNVYPNPLSGFVLSVTIPEQISAATLGTSVKLYNQFGMEYSYSISEINANSIQVNIPSELPNGLYFIKFNNINCTSTLNIMR